MEGEEEWAYFRRLWKENKSIPREYEEKKLRGRRKTWIKKERWSKYVQPQE